MLAAKSIAKRGHNSTDTGRIKHLLHHDPTQMPGKIIHLEEKKVNGWQGVYFETKMSMTALGEETLIKYQEGIYDNHSIGYKLYLNQRQSQYQAANFMIWFCSCPKS